MPGPPAGGQRAQDLRASGEARGTARPRPRSAGGAAGRPRPNARDRTRGGGGKARHEWPERHTRQDAPKGIHMAALQSSQEQCGVD